MRQDAEINRLNREIFKRAVEVGDDPDLREWAMFMILVARCLERIGDNTVDIAEQTVFVVTGLFREFAELVPHAYRGRAADALTGSGARPHRVTCRGQPRGRFAAGSSASHPGGTCTCAALASGRLCSGHCVESEGQAALAQAT